MACRCISSFYNFVRSLNMFLKIGLILFGDHPLIFKVNMYKNTSVLSNPRKRKSDTALYKIFINRPQ